MNNLRKRFERFCYQNRDKGIPNLMLYISLGCGLVYLFTSMTRSDILYSLLVFDRTAIFHGQVWRLLTYPLTFYNSNVLLMALMLYCYYTLGRAMETLWGTLRFNLFYLTGIVMMDVYCLLFGGQADVTYLNMSLFLSYLGGHIGDAVAGNRQVVLGVDVGEGQRHLAGFGVVAEAGGVAVNGFHRLLLT